MWYLEWEKAARKPTKWPSGPLICLFSPNCKNWSTRGWNENLRSFSAIGAYSPALHGSTGIFQGTPELGEPPPCCFHWWQQIHTEEMWQAWKSLETSAWSIIHNDWFGGSHWPQCGGRHHPDSWTKSWDPLSDLTVCGYSKVWYGGLL